MVRVLQLLEKEADFQTRRSVEMLSRELGSDYEVTVRTIGHGGDFRNLAHAMLALRRATGKRWDVVHAWGGRALGAAAMGAARSTIYSPAGVVSARSVRWANAVMSYRQLHVICASAAVRKLFVQRGVPIDRCHLIRPAVEFSRLKRRRNPQLRTALGFSEADHVLLAAGESTWNSGHELAVWAGAILNILDPRHKLLIWGRGNRTQAVTDLAEKLQKRGLIRVAERELGRSVEFEEILGAVDLIVVTSKEHAPTLPIAISMASALPIVGTVNYTTSELLEDRHTALMVADGSARLLARRIMDLRESPSLQWSIADMARTEAYEYFAQTRFIEQYRAVYRQIAEGKTVKVPEQAAGAGMRFHGRA